MGLDIFKDYFLKRLGFAWLLLGILATPGLAGSGDPVILLSAQQGPDLLNQCSRNTPKGLRNFWAPARADVDALEQKLRALLRSGLDPRFRQVGILGNYGRQYVGFTLGGKRYLYGNFYPASLDKEARTGSIDFCDGGPSFWGVTYEVKTGIFEGVEFNGSY